MSAYYSSIFNEVFGPVMVGTSSSHTAGPHRIGAIARMLFGAQLKSVRISFDPESSYAAYYQLQWSDRGFTAGLLGIPIDSGEIADALQIAEARGITMTFVKEPKENKEPDYALLEMEGVEGEQMTLGTVSLGGGSVEIIALDGFPVQIKGDFNVAFCYLESDADVAAVTEKIRSVIQNEARFQTSGHSGRTLLTLETRADLSEQQLQAILALAGVEKVRYADHVLPVLSRFQYEDMPFRTAAEALKVAEKEGWSAGELGIRYEMARSGYSRADVLAIMKNIIHVMRASIQRGLDNDSDEKVGGLYRLNAHDMYEQVTKKTQKIVDLGVLSEIVCVAIAVSETIEVERPGTVVASPTIGSVGIIPASVVYLGDRMGLDEDAIAMAMFAAGSVGVFVAHQATFGGEVAGCQAECGSAGAMAAAGVVELLGGTAAQAYMAATISLQNVLGQICDAVSVGYEPCNARNAMAAANALSTANMVLCGYEVKIPLDETIETMNHVGSQLPACLKGTFGGLCCTPTGKRIAAFCEDKTGPAF